jgi:hypothetical protein
MIPDTTILAMSNSMAGFDIELVNCSSVPTKTIPKMVIVA